MFLLLFLPCVLSQTFYSSASGTNIINVCHCDLNKNFCDYYCCCDPDCSSLILNGLKTNSLLCQNNTQVTYCLNPLYYAYINVSPDSKTSVSPSTECYDFNRVNNDQPEISLGLSDIQKIVGPQQALGSLEPQSYYTGGYSNNIVVIKTANELVTSSGQCSSANSGTGTSIYFGVDSSVTCTSNLAVCNAQNINLFQQFAGINILGFNGETSTNLKTPNITSYSNSGNCLTQLTLVIFYSQLGVQSQPIYYIVDTRFSYVYTSQVATYTMAVQYVDYDSLTSTAGTTSAPFFPMIPPDMFYPLVYSLESLLGWGSLSLIVLFVI